MFKIFSYKYFKFGDQPISQFIIFECKYFFSIIFYYFYKSLGSQDVFHDHAFNSFSIKIFGEYDEHILIDNEFIIKKRMEIFKFFPKRIFHRIANSNGCLTLLFSGPWENSWKEYDNGHIKNYKWGRIAMGV